MRLVTSCKSQVTGRRSQVANCKSQFVTCNLQPLEKGCYAEKINEFFDRYEKGKPKSQHERIR